MESPHELDRGVDRASRRGRIVVVLLFLCIVADLAGLGTGFAQLRLLERDFLEWFPGVTRVQAKAVLSHAAASHAVAG